MNTLVKNGLLLASLLGVLGCDSTEPRPEAFVIETDRAVYSPLDTVVVSFVNGRDSTAYVMSDGCGSLDRKPLPVLWFERREEVEWEPYAQGYFCPAALQAPAELPPGGTYHVQFRVGVTRLPELPPGTYRYVFLVVGEPYENDTILPEEERRSNAFEVRE